MGKKFRYENDRGERYVWPERALEDTILESARWDTRATRARIAQMRVGDTIRRGPERLTRVAGLSGALAALGAAQGRGQRGRRRRAVRKAQGRRTGRHGPPLAPLMKWPGGKARLASRIVGHLPPHRTYVEPFAGSASVFFRKPSAETEVLGDQNQDLMRFYSKMRTGGLRKCQGGFKMSRRAFDEARRKKDACSFLASVAMSVGGNRRTFFDNGATYRSKLKRLREYEARVRRAYLARGDFAETMRRFDSAETLHFLDPPWLSSWSEFYDKSEAGSPAHVRAVAMKMKGTVVVVYEDVPATRKVFCGRGWKCRSIPYKGWGGPFSRHGAEKRMLMAIRGPKRGGGRRSPRPRRRRR